MYLVNQCEEPRGFQLAGIDNCRKSAVELHDCIKNIEVLR